MEDKKITAEELLGALDLDLKAMIQKMADAINNGEFTFEVQRGDYGTPQRVFCS